MTKLVSVTIQRVTSPFTRRSQAVLLCTRVIKGCCVYATAVREKREQQVYVEKRGKKK